MKITAILLIVLILMVGCTNSQNGSNQEVAELSPWAVEMLERLERTSVSYVISGPYTPADRDIDLRRIERFVFSDNINAAGYGFAMDRLHNNRVYYNPQFATVERLDSFPYSAELREEDFDRLIAAIEQSGLRDWPDRFTGENIGTGGRGWVIGILFDDGTIMRRSGVGMTADGFPPAAQWNVWTVFIDTIGAEIQERQAVEESERDMQEIAGFMFSYSTSGRFRAENDRYNYRIGYRIIIDRTNRGMRYAAWKESEYRGDRDTRVRDESEFFAVFGDEDLERLIEAIEQSGVLGWDGRYTGPMSIPSGDPRPREWEDRYFDYMIDSSDLDLQRRRGGTSWTLIITLEDGTIIQREGSGATIESIPPAEEFRLLLDFVHAMGQEIQEQHHYRLTSSE